MNGTTSKNTRAVIVTVLEKVEKEKVYLQLALKEDLKDLAPLDRNFCTEIAIGTMKYKMRLDYVLNKFSKVPVRKMKPFIRQLMRMSVYQLLFLERIPDRAVINEAVKLVHQRKMSALSSFVNGTLRTIAREKENIVYPSLTTAEGISIYHSLPQWIIEEWLGTYGLEETLKIAEAFNERAKVTLRTNTLITTCEQVKENLEQEGLTVTPGVLNPEALVVKGLNNIANHPDFLSGKWTVQDESAMLVGHVLDPQPFEKILDMCSAPGGKSTHLAQLMQNTGEIISCDVHPHKVTLIAKNAERMGIGCITPCLQDGIVQRQDFVGQFDKVLLDAPCSGLGILKRKPDIRYDKTLQDSEAIAALQKQLLQNASTYLKPNGILVYSTCTLTRRENQDMVDFAVKELGFALEPISPYLPKTLLPFVTTEGMILILPHYADSDGFFIARLRKKAD